MKWVLVVTTTCSATNDDNVGIMTIAGFPYNDIDNTSDGDKNLAIQCTNITCLMTMYAVLLRFFFVLDPSSNVTRADNQPWSTVATEPQQNTTKRASWSEFLACTVRGVERGF